MDQRTDNERPQEAPPGRERRSAIALPRKPQAWIDWMARRRRAVLVVTALIIAAIVAITVWWINTSGYETTDDAFIDARTVSISSQVGGAIVDVPVTDNQMVEAGAAGAPQHRLAGQFAMKLDRRGMHRLGDPGLVRREPITALGLAAALEPQRRHMQ